jgi:glyoxylase-like metal-dependent hydrolase (beta-lactamase superfamily II)
MPRLHRGLALASALSLAAAAPAAAQELFDLRPVAPNVYFAYARPEFFPISANCNAVVVLLDDGVLVVDTHSRPSAAKVLIAQIRKITSKPVRYVVDTHFHSDHYQGNEAYLSAWPATAEIISSELTKEAIEHIGIPRIRNEIATLPPAIAARRDSLAGASDSLRAAIADRIRNDERYLGELMAMHVTLPTVTFDHSLVIRRPSTTVEILWLGRGHTDGDVVVFLPKQRVIATGDLIHGGTPYMADGYPYDWIHTLEAVEKLDFDVALGGHGDLIRGKEAFGVWEGYFRDLMASTADAYGAGATLDEAKNQVAPGLVARWGSRFPADRLERSVRGNIAKAYHVISGETN